MTIYLIIAIALMAAYIYFTHSSKDSKKLIILEEKIKKADEEIKVEQVKRVDKQKELEDVYDIIKEINDEKSNRIIDDIKSSYRN